MPSLSGSSSGETAAYVVTKTLAPQDYKPQEGQCTHYTLVEKDGCVKPRTCEDCLLKEGCMINQFGVCVDQLTDGYNKDMDFRVAQKLNLTFPSAAEKNASTEQRWHFPAFGAEYCDTSDAVCKQCRQAKDWFHDGIGADSRYCVGDGGCICISVCDSTTWEASMPALCPLMSEFPEVNSGLSVAGTMLSLGFTFLSIGSCIWCCKRSRRERKERAQEEDVKSPSPDEGMERDSKVYVHIKRASDIRASIVDQGVRQQGSAEDRQPEQPQEPPKTWL